MQLFLPGNCDLIAHYTFKPDRFLDDSSGQTGTLQNIGGVSPNLGSQTGWMTGNQNVAYFDGTGYLQLPPIEITNPFSVCAWYYPKYTSGIWQRVCDLGNGPVTTNIILARYSDTNSLCFALYYDGSALINWEIPGFWVYEKWQHVCVVVSGNWLFAFTDGIQRATTTISIRYPTVKIDHGWLGKSQWPWDGNFQGFIDEFRIYKKALTEAEVYSLYVFRNDTENTAATLSCPPGSYIVNCKSG